jgi:hypothetical protein
MSSVFHASSEIPTPFHTSPGVHIRYWPNHSPLHSNTVYDCKWIPLFQRNMLKHLSRHDSVTVKTQAATSSEMAKSTYNHAACPPDDHCQFCYLHRETEFKTWIPYFVLSSDEGNRTSYSSVNKILKIGNDQTSCKKQIHSYKSRLVKLTCPAQKLIQ